MESWLAGAIPQIPDVKVNVCNTILLIFTPNPYSSQVGGQAVLGRQNILPTPWLTERHGYDPTSTV